MAKTKRRNVALAKMLLLTMVTYLLMASLALTAYAGSTSDTFSSSSTSSGLYTLISGRISSTDTTDTASVTLLDDLFDDFSSASDSADSGASTLVSYTWVHNGETVTKYFSNITLSGDTADENYVDLYNGLSSTITKAGVSTKDNTVSKVKSDLDLIADIANPAVDLLAGKNVIQPFIPGISKLSGTVVNACLLFLGLGTALDVFYLTIPFVHRNCDSAGQSGNKAMTGKVKETGESKFRLISDDAMIADAKAQEDGGFAVWIYAGRRWKTYVCVVLVIVLLLTKSMTSLISVVLTLLGGVISEISGAFSG